MSRSGVCVRCAKQRDDLDAEGCCAPCLFALCDQVLEQLRKLPPDTEVPSMLPGVLVTERDRL